jgi:hypothetical protein
MDEVIAERITHGIVSVTGTAFEQRIILKTGSGPVRLLATAADSAALVRVAGTEISARGEEAPRGALRLERFTVISVDGLPVVDGVLRGTPAHLVIATQKGELPLGNPPDSLRHLVGARVWIGGPLDAGPNQFGVIAPASR